MSGGRSGGLGAGLKVLWDFTRPHTIIGTTTAVSVLYLVARLSCGEAALGVYGLVLFSALAVNLYVVGLNQITDVEIDRDNKPFLPIPRGSLSLRGAVRIVAIAGVLALVSAGLGGLPLFVTIATILGLGTLYSLPPRLKNSPLLAAATITAARGVVLNIGVYTTYGRAMGLEGGLPSFMLAFLIVIFVDVVVISLMKDVPDIRGDARFGVATFARRLGPRRMTWLSMLMLGASTAVLGAFAWDTEGVNGPLWVVLHGVGRLYLVGLARRVSPTSNDSVVRYYMGIWKIFYLEYGLLLLSILMK